MGQGNEAITAALGAKCTQVRRISATAHSDNALPPRSPAGCCSSLRIWFLSTQGSLKGSRGEDDGLGETFVQKIKSAGKNKELCRV